MQRIKIILADDHNIVREGLRAIVQTDPEIEIVGEAENGHQAVQLVKRVLPSVAVLDIVMPQMDGLEAARQIVAAVPTTRVLILSSYSSRAYIDKLMEAGVAGYLLKSAAGDEFLHAIREVDQGNAYFSPEIARCLRDQWRESLLTGKPIRSEAPATELNELSLLETLSAYD